MFLATAAELRAISPMTYCQLSELDNYIQWNGTILTNEQMMWKFEENSAGKMLHIPLLMP